MWCESQLWFSRGADLLKAHPSPVIIHDVGYNSVNSLCLTCALCWAMLKECANVPCDWLEPSLPFRRLERLGRSKWKHTLSAEPPISHLDTFTNFHLNSEFWKKEDNYLLSESGPNKLIVPLNLRHDQKIFTSLISSLYNYLPDSFTITSEYLGILSNISLQHSWLGSIIIFVLQRVNWGMMPKHRLPQGLRGG